MLGQVGWLGGAGATRYGEARHPGPTAAGNGDSYGRSSGDSGPGAAATPLLRYEVRPDLAAIEYP